MTITWKEILLGVCLLIGAFFIGAWVGCEIMKKDLAKELSRIEEITKQEEEEIKDLEEEMDRVDTVINVVKEKEIVIDTLRVKEFERLKTLPLDSSVRLLKQNLLDYENFNPISN